MKTNSVPKIRFKGFTDDWEQRKLGEVADKTYGGGTPKTSIEEYWQGNIPWIQSQDLSENKVFGVEPRKYINQKAIENSATKIIPKNSIAIITRVGVGKLALMPISYCTSQDFLSLSSLKINELYATYVIYKMLQIEKEKVQGTSIKGITSAELLSKKIDVPIKYAEQQKIGEYFSNLDRLITLHQRKCDQTKELKKFMFQKMFPKKGEKNPEIRFSGFTDDWEQRKLGELGEIMTGSTPSTATSKYYSEHGIPWVTPTDIEGTIISDTSKKLSEEGVKVGRVVPANTILCTCIASIGKNALLTVKGSFNQQINSLTPSQENNPYFLLTESELWSKELKRIAGAGTMQIVNKSEFSELSTMVPRLDEQQKIGEYFSNLDRLITLHQRKCEQLKELKKFMLQNMFPKKG